MPDVPPEFTKPQARKSGGGTAHASVPSMAELLSPLDEASFFSDYWERAPLHVRRADPDFNGAVFGFGDVDRVLRCAAKVDGESLFLVPPPTSDRRGRKLSPATTPLEIVYRAFRGGDSIRLTSAQDFWPSLRELNTRVGAFLDADTNSNLYVTPPGAQGFPIHADGHDVFVVQLDGSKAWRVFEPEYRMPVFSLEHMGTMRSKLRARYEETELQIHSSPTLEAGDCLYIPRGFPHCATSGPRGSVHVSVGIHPMYFVDLLKAAVELAAADQPAWRAALPPGFVTQDSCQERVRQELLKIIPTLESALSGDQTIRRALGALAAKRAARELLPADGHFEQLLTLDDLQEGSRMRRRDGIIPRVQIDRDGSAEIFFASNRVSGPGVVAPVFRHVCEHEEFIVGELPGDLDADEKLMICRKLVEEGLLRFDEANG